MPNKRRKNNMEDKSAMPAASPIERVDAAEETVHVNPGCNQHEIAALAYKLWQERGCPIGSDQEDWFRAENELKREKASAASAG